MLQVREVVPKDVHTANKWRMEWNTLPLAEEIHPSSGLVLVDTDTKEELFIGYIWLSNSNMAQIGFIVRNRYYSKKNIAKQNKENFIRELTSHCYKLGYTHVISWAQNPSLISDFKNIGFTETGNHVSELIIKLT